MQHWNAIGKGSILLPQAKQLCYLESMSKMPGLSNCLCLPQMLISVWMYKIKFSRANLIASCLLVIMIMNYGWNLSKFITDGKHCSPIVVVYCVVTHIPLLGRVPRSSHVCLLGKTKQICRLKNKRSLTIFHMLNISQEMHLSQVCGSKFTCCIWWSLIYFGLICTMKKWQLSPMDEKHKHLVIAWGLSHTARPASIR